ncbi:MAG: 16S rRNA (cytosine(967)-C(5))-methyltransferase RsmB [Clostridia bacterium]|nr:16S rRNA (cytosine(967)-C(5))-methyltransferase RsmB [Clostridia bacterium]
MNVREIARRTLLRMNAAGGYSNLSLDAAIKKYEMSPRDRALLTQLVMGVIERQTTLDYYISALSSMDDAKIEPEVRMILRLGLYQLMFCDRIPAHAAVSETVSLAPRRAAGFVNALLRNYSRRGGEVKLPDAESDPVGHISVKYSFPRSVCERFVSEYGAQRAEAIFAAMNEPPRLTLRVNTCRTTRDKLIARLCSEGIEARPTPLASTGIVLPSVPVTQLPGFETGDFTVQDEASQLCTAALDARAGMKVIDVCSAPGSKSFGAAMDMGNDGEILAFDLHESKLSLIRSGAERLGLDIITADCANGRVFDAALAEYADRVICDVPCSGYGVMAKKPEIRHKDPAESARLPEIQYDILQNCSKYVKHGGVLVYSTCTLLRAENDEIIDKFLANHADFALVGFHAGELDVPEGRITLAPDTHSTDGFFIAKLQRC